VEFAVSTDGKVFEAVSTVANDISPRLADITIKEFAGVFPARPVRFVRVRAKAISTVPDWHFGAGGKAWLFADEIIVD
jgi:hexosaminidase